MSSPCIKGFHFAGDCDDSSTRVRPRGMPLLGARFSFSAAWLKMLRLRGGIAGAFRRGERSCTGAARRGDRPSPTNRPVGIGLGSAMCTSIGESLISSRKLVSPVAVFARDSGFLVARFGGGSFAVRRASGEILSSSSSGSGIGSLSDRAVRSVSSTESSRTSGSDEASVSGIVLINVSNDAAALLVGGGVLDRTCADPSEPLVELW